MYFSAEMKSLLHPIQFLQRKFYMNAACTQEVHIDQSYVERLLNLVSEFRPGYKLLLYAFEQAHDESGKPLPERSTFYVPNDYVLNLAHRYPKHFEWVCSIHPYRPDALTALDSAIANGARAVKWLPSAIGIDPTSPKCDAFYKRLAQHNLPLICHAGDEKAVEGIGLTGAGNPLKLRRALDAGVRVIVAHCASIGDDIDLDKGEHGPRVTSFELFARMMREERYQTHLFGDISAITQINRSTDILRTLIEHQEWHDRLLNGSDYPLPGVLPLISPRKLAEAGLLPPSSVTILDEIQTYNPLLFDFVLKRLLRVGTLKLSDCIFHTRDFFTR
jgi:mannonate dehydratase